MPYTIDNAPDRIKKLPAHAQRIWISAYNSAYDQYGKDEEKANKVAWAAVKKVYKKVGDKWVRKATSYIFPICLSNAIIKKRMEIHILPIGEWEHAFYGKIKIQEEDVEEFVQNFYKGIRKGVSVTEGHDGGLGSGELPAIGWFRELINKGKKGLWGIVEWTEKGRELLEQKAFKYFSPEFFSVYEDPETHKLYNNVLTGGALTNSPYFKGLKSIVMSELLLSGQFDEENIMLKKEKESKKNLSEDEEKEKGEEEVEEEKGEEKGEEKEEETANLEEEEEPEEEEKEEGKEEEEKEGEEKKVYNCECLKCGYTVKSDKHCADIKCPECGGDMRRVERPGPGKKEATEEEGGEEKAEEKVEEKEEEKGEEKELSEAKKFVVWTTKYINDLPDSSFAYVEADGKDKEGKTVPRSLRHLPYKDASGKVDLPHLRNAIARAPLVKDKNGNKISSAVVKRIQKKLQAILAKSRKKSSEVKSDIVYRQPAKDLSDSKKIVYQVISPSSVELSEKENLSEFKKEILRVGEWFHNASKDGVLKVTKETLEQIVKNFKDKVLDNVMVPLGHPTTDDPSKNAGEIKDLEVTADDRLLATIDVKDETVAEKIKNGLIKGISASIAEDYTKKDTGEKVGPTLFHAALVTEPYIKGMASFVPLSEELEGSLVVPIFNIEEPLTMKEMGDRIEKIEKTLKLDEKEETSEEETSEEETSEEEKTESSEVGEEAEKEEKEETKPGETKTEETKTETEEAKEGVDLAEAEKMFGVLLEEGRVTPAEKELLLPLLASDTPIELSEGKKVESGKALYKYLKEQAPKFSLQEEGTTEDEKEKKGKEEEIPEDIDKKLSEMEFTDPEEKKAAYKEFNKESKEKKEKGESTPF